MPLIITETSSKPFEKCALDIVGPLSVTTLGNKYLFRMTSQNLVKFTIPLLNQEATTVAKEFIQE